MQRLFITALACLISVSVLSQTPVLIEDFENYYVGDYIGESSSYWTTWSGTTGTDEDGIVSDEFANSGFNSLKIFGNVSGGPMDVYLPIGFNNPYEVSFHILIPNGYSAYFNIQEYLQSGVAWAFEMIFDNNGQITLSIDQVINAITYYNQGSWVHIRLFMDPTSDLAAIVINNELMNIIPFDESIGGLNFFGYGDGVTPGLYFIDDVIVVETDNITNETIIGCTDYSACNYSPESTIDDGSCWYSQLYYDCNGNCILDNDNDGVCDELEILGCTGESACNYNFIATEDDFSCVYIGDSCDDGEPNTANDIIQEDCSCLGENLVVGCTYVVACNYNPEAEIDDMSCVFIGDSCNDGDPNTDNDIILDDCSCLGESPVIGCIYPAACNYNPEAEIGDTSCIFIGDSCDDGDPSSENDVIQDDCECSGTIAILGCTNVYACNYYEEATIENDSCILIGDPCDDEDPNTEDDEIQEDCNCSGTLISTVDELEAFSVLIYPNPASNNLTIDLGALTGLNTTVKLYDSSSKLVFEEQSSSTLLIDVSSYAKGLYTLELSTTDKVLRSQVVIE